MPIQIAAILFARIFIVSTYTNLKLKNSVARCVKESVKRVLCVTQHMSAGLGSRVHEH